VSTERRPYRPDALLHLLREVERELRAHRRAYAASMVRIAVSAVAEDLANKS
jgi:hypothetical protein